jgi:hypothetical protein
MRPHVTRHLVSLASLCVALGSALPVAGVIIPTLPAAPFSRTILVGGSGNAATNGAALIAAITGLNATGCAAANTRWLIRLEPGIFNIPQTLSMQNCVDIEGSGRDVTTIISTRSFQGVELASVILFPEVTAELRELTVENSSSSSVALGVAIVNGNARLSRVNVVATGTGGTIAISVTGASPVLDDVTVTTSSSAGSSSSKVTGLDLFATTAVLHRVSVSIASPNTENTGIYIEHGAAPSVDQAEVTISGGASDAGIWVAQGSSLNMTRSTVTSTGETAFGIEDEGGGTVEVTYSSIAATASSPAAGSPAAAGPVTTGKGFGIYESGVVPGGTLAIASSTVDASNSSIGAQGSVINQLIDSRIDPPPPCNCTSTNCYRVFACHSSRFPCASVPTFPCG